MPVRLLPIVAAALALAAAAPAGAAFRGTNGELGYEGKASAAGAILLASHGGGVRRLAAPGKPADPAFSPLGRRIAFSSRSEIWVMFEDGTSVRQVTVGPEPSRDPTWSPAADALAFTTGYAGDRDLYSVSADGNRLHQLTSGRGDDRSPAWGPTGSIAFVRDDDVYLKAPGHRARPLTGGAADDRDPVWSPDGRRIAFTRLPERVPAPKAKNGRKRKRPAPRVRELWVMRANGSKARRLKQLPAAVSSPAWSPDGRRLAFAMGRSGRRGLYTIRTTGHGLRQVGSRAADPRAIDWQPRGGDPVIAAAGDIACDPDLTRYATGLGTRDACHMLQTSDLLMNMDVAAVLPLGDLQYEDGTLDKLQRSFDPTWGRLKAQMHPAVGNHEYRTAGAQGYFDYFNGPGAFDGPAGPRDKGYYSYDLGAWHVVTLNSQCSHPAADNPYENDCAAGSPQEQWLRADLAAHPARCTLAVWHHPWFSSGLAGRNDAVQPLFQALYDNDVDVLLTGHDHGYERFAPMDATGNRDGARGVRQFVVGTGGKNKEPDLFPQPNSEIRENASFGVLKMTLRPGAYLWEFVRDGGTFTDTGANACH